MRKSLIAACVALALALPLSAQQVTKVGICDWTKVLTTSYKESKAVRELEDFRAAYQKEVQAVTRDISDLENQRLDADKAGNKDLSLQLEKKLNDKKAYLDEFRRIKSDSYKRQAEKVLSSVQFIKEIRDAITYVAESEGFALILREDGDVGQALILDNIPEIDITQKVIKRLYEQAGKTYTGGE